jgi:uncharacterized membrane protein (DUF485 family)
MTDDIIERVRANPRYHALARERSVLGGILSAIVLAGFIAFILMMGFARHFLGEPMAAGSSISIGFPIGFGFGVICMICSGFYVWRANKDFDRLIAEIVKEAHADAEAQK